MDSQDQQDRRVLEDLQGLKGPLVLLVSQVTQDRPEW